MAELIDVGIAGIGAYAPERRVTNAELAERVDTSDEWIQQRTGIEERRIAGDDEAAGDLAREAGLRALADGDIDPAEVDLIICATVSGDQPFPATACRIGAEIGAVNAGGWDLGAACSGWVFAGQVAANFIATGTYKCVLVVGVEKLSAIVDFQSRETCVLFGDGAGATVFTPFARAKRALYLGGSTCMDGAQEEVLMVPAGGSRHPASHETVEHRMHFIRMGGKKVYRFAVKTLAELVETSIEPYGYDELGLVIPHQVNLRIIESAAERIGLPMEKVFVNIQKYGNTSAASVPLALDEALRAGRLESGKLICMPAFGAGMAWGHLLVRW